MKVKQLGVHWIPASSRQEDLVYIDGLQPGSVKILNPNIEQISFVHVTVPAAVIVLRDHPMSEQHDAMASDPIGLAIQHANEWRIKIDAWRNEAIYKSVPFPDDDKLIVLGINEPHVWTALQQTVDYTVEFIKRCAEKGLHVGALNLSVGWPANTGEGMPPNWTPYNSVHTALQQYGGYLVVHEYWDINGPEENWGWWAGRITKCPWQDIRILIGEAGIDRKVQHESWEGTRGWLGHKTGTEYTDELIRYLDMLQSDGRIHSAMPFTTNFGSNDWYSFDTKPAMDVILHAKDRIPNVNNDIIVDPPIKPPDASIVWPAKGVLTQRFYENYERYMTLFNSAGHNGIDIASNIATPVLAMAEGVVAWVDTHENYGLYVRVWHKELNVHSFYAHLERNDFVERGQHVVAGQQIGVMGNTGASTGRHLHFETRLGGGSINSYGQAAFGHTRGRVDPQLYFYMLLTAPNQVVEHIITGSLTLSGIINV